MTTTLVCLFGAACLALAYAVSRMGHASSQARRAGRRARSYASAPPAGTVAARERFAPASAPPAPASATYLVQTGTRAVIEPDGTLTFEPVWHPVDVRPRSWRGSPLRLVAGRYQTTPEDLCERLAAGTARLVAAESSQEVQP